MFERVHLSTSQISADILDSSEISTTDHAVNSRSSLFLFLEFLPPVIVGPLTVIGRYAHQLTLNALLWLVKP